MTSLCLNIIVEPIWTQGDSSFFLANHIEQNLAVSIDGRKIPSESRVVWSGPERAVYDEGNSLIGTFPQNAAICFDTKLIRRKHEITVQLPSTTGESHIASVSLVRR